MTDTFVIDAVFRPRQRAGPVLVGRASGPVRVGSSLSAAGDALARYEVLAVEMRTPKSAQEGTVSVVVDRDGPELAGGTEFQILDASG
jgi:hypothetical protein